MNDARTPEERTAARADGLLAWQNALYDAGHRTRANLLVHALTVPIFLAGTIATLALPLVTGRPWLAAVGPIAMALAVALQGRTHAREPTAPVPFLGPGDAIARLCAEQWITFPRFVVTGRFARAWRAAAPSA